jgi:hypothetical protein
MIDRKGVIGDADLQMMAINLVGRSDSETNSEVAIRVSRNGNDISSTRVHSVKYEAVVRRSDSTTIWAVSDDAIDYEITETLERYCLPLETLSYVKCGNGGFVWNQNKDILCESQIPGAIPLVSAASIASYSFQFPYEGSHPTHTRPYALVTDKVEARIHSESAILIKRTTPTKVGRRLIAGMPDEGFHAKYPTYFLENHVNYIKLVQSASREYLYGLMGWLNSDLVNFLFQLRNGTTQVSVHELKHLPVKETLIEHIAHLARRITDARSDEARQVATRNLNLELFESFNLKPKHRKRIGLVLNRKETSH